MVMAHPDDEVIFGWPILQDTRFTVSILFCSTDQNNIERKHGSNRIDALSALSLQLGIKVFCFPYSSEFYRLETRRGALKEFIREVGERISEIVDSEDIDFIFSHNPYGEYGNLDHILINHISMAYGEKPLVYTDMIQEVNWSPIKAIKHGYARLYYADTDKLVEKCTLNNGFYEMCREFYIERKAWTWSYDPIKECALYGRIV